MIRFAACTMSLLACLISDTPLSDHDHAPCRWWLVHNKRYIVIPRDQLTRVSEIAPNIDTADYQCVITPTIPKSILWVRTIACEKPRSHQTTWAACGRRDVMTSDSIYVGVSLRIACECR